MHRAFSRSFTSAPIHQPVMRCQAGYLAVGRDSSQKVALCYITLEQPNLPTAMPSRLQRSPYQGSRSREMRAGWTRARPCRALHGGSRRDPPQSGPSVHSIPSHLKSSYIAEVNSDRQRCGSRSSLRRQCPVAVGRALLPDKRRPRVAVLPSNEDTTGGRRSGRGSPSLDHAKLWDGHYNGPRPDRSSL